MPDTRILVVDDDEAITNALELILGDQGYKVQTASKAVQAEFLLSSTLFDLVFLDLRLPDADGLNLLARIKSEVPDTEVVLMTAHGSLDVTIEAIKRGAFYYVEKPFTLEQLLILTQRALEFKAFKCENQLRKSMQAHLDDFGIVGNSPKMRQVRAVIRTAAPSDASVLIEGESGTGKELIATALHSNSERSSRPFIRINCAAIPRELIESELFGYRKGAFTGAHRDRRGLIEATQGGTLLLDEIAEMPVYLQTKLLRVLQERTVRRLGDEREAPMGNFQNYRRVPRAVKVVDRSLREETLGVYSTTVNLPRNGAYDVSLLLDSPRIVHCFEAFARPNPAVKRERETALRIEYLNKQRSLRAGEDYKIRFRLTNAENNRARNGLKDVRVLVFLTPGIWQKRETARSTGDGVYEFEVKVPEEGVYMVFVESPSQRVRYLQLPFLTLHATSSISAPAAENRM